MRGGQRDVMAALAPMEEVVLKEEFVFVDEYFPIDLHEEEVVAETIEAADVVNEQRDDHEEIIHGERRPTSPPHLTLESLLILISFLLLRPFILSSRGPSVRGSSRPPATVPSARSIQPDEGPYL